MKLKWNWKEWNETEMKLEKNEIKLKWNWKNEIKIIEIKWNEIK